MPAISNITVKKNDGVTDITYTAQAPSSGDNSPAVWKATTVGTAPGHQPELRVSSRTTGDGKKRALRATYKYPQIATNTTTGVTSIVDQAGADINWVIPVAMSTADINEFASQLANLIASTLMKDSVKQGYAAS